MVRILLSHLSMGISKIRWILLVLEREKSVAHFGVSSFPALKMGWIFLMRIMLRVRISSHMRKVFANISTKVSG